MHGKRGIARSGASALFLLLGLAGHAVEAQVEVCHTVIGWCEIATEAEPCTCDAHGEIVTGTRVVIEDPSPFARLDPAPPADRVARSGAVAASRAFAGPLQYPPTDFAAYGIVAFPSRATSGDINRHLMICEAYSAALPRDDELSLERSEQMTTVWPLASDALLSRISQMDPVDACELAVENYGLVQSLRALALLEEQEGVERRVLGPLLIAWTPTDAIEGGEAAAMVVDLSEVDDFDEAQEAFLTWRSRIQENADLWRSDEATETRFEKIILVLREFFDENGDVVLPR